MDLVALNTLFNREHNRIATQLAIINPVWNDEVLFYETRRIIIAIFQHIIYNEYLPTVIGNKNLSPLTTTQYYNGYNSSVSKKK